MSDHDAQRLKDLEARIAALKAKDAPKHHSEEHYSQASVAWRMVSELVVGLAMGCGIGMGLDALLGTKPILMIIFLFLGFAAGVKTMMRTAEDLGRTEPDAAQDEGEERG